MTDDTDGAGGSETCEQPEATDTDPTTIRHDWQQSDQPSVVIIEAVAAVTDRPATELPLLQSTIDTDALDTLLKGQTSSVTISFAYADTTVWVSGNGSIEIQVDGDLAGEHDA